MVDSVADATLKQMRDGNAGGTAQPVSASGTFPVSVAGTLSTVPGPSAAQGNTLSLLKIISAATDNAAVVKAGAGRLYTLYAQNTTAAWKFLKLYNKVTAPGAGDVPIITLGIPPNGAIGIDDPYAHAFTTGIGVRITGASPDADATATAVGDVLATIGFM